MLLALVALAADPAVAAAPHYDLHAYFSPAGQVDADVTVTLPPGTHDKGFLLSRRFTLRRLDMPRGVTLASTKPAEEPVEGLNRYSFHVAPGLHGPIRLGFHYAGPISPAGNEPVMPLRPEGYELFIDDMWFPVGDDIQTRFSLDAEIEGLAPDLVVVAQGDVHRTAHGVRIHRRFLDIDIPMVAMRGLKRADAAGVEFYARDLSTRVSQLYIRHSEGAARFYAGWYGPLTETVRIAVVPRRSTMGYARTGYTVMSESHSGPAEIDEADAARHAAHEIAHVWWKLASPIGDDFWLVESCAEYSALRYVESALGPTAAARLVDDKRAPAATAGPIMGHGRPNRVQLYQKGPLLLLDLEHRIGRPAMDRLMARMAHEPVHTTAIFLRLLTEISGADAARAFDAALHA
ncbi:MAG TPA: hypothetical protein VFW19_03810 [Allosphingosinicella sp.]|nr:hypothetical protein [Allosphingosinicella sp.]